MNLIISLIYSIGWFVCVLAGAKGFTLVPIAYTVVTLAFYFLVLRKESKTIFCVNILLIWYGLILGFIFETLLLSTYQLSYATKNAVCSLFPPAWILCLYLLFTPTLNHFFSFLRRSRFFPPLFGFIGGPLCVYAGTRLDAAFISESWFYLIIAVFWALFLSLLDHINLKLLCLANQIFDAKRLNKPLTVLFDGFCSFCATELKHLQKRPQTGVVTYYSITTKDQFSKDYPKLEFKDVMKEIYAIEATGHILKGPVVFFELYARTSHPLLALLSKAPGLVPLVNVLYRLWAKFRLTKRTKPF